MFKVTELRQTVEHEGVTDTRGDVSLPGSVGSDKGLVLTPESQTRALSQKIVVIYL